MKTNFLQRFVFFVCYIFSALVIINLLIPIGDEFLAAFLLAYYFLFALLALFAAAKLPLRYCTALKGVIFALLATLILFLAGFLCRFYLFDYFMLITVGVGGTVLWIWMLYDCDTNEPSQGNEKTFWILLLVPTHFIGALLYLFFRRRERIRLYGR